MRSDLQLQQDVLDELNWEPAVNAASIGVEAKEGIVTLSGHVDTFSEKWSAENAAQRVFGVKALAVEIQVKLLVDGLRTDADIAGSANNILLWSNYLTNQTVQIMVEKGWITLTGRVEWAYQKTRLAAALSHLIGVTGLSNQIAIASMLNPQAVKADIELALKRHAIEGAKGVMISVQGSEVTLSGHVHSWAERDLVNHSAWNTSGVKNVLNHIAII